MADKIKNTSIFYKTKEKQNDEVIKYYKVILFFYIKL